MRNTKKPGLRAGRFIHDRFLIEGHPSAVYGLGFVDAELFHCLMFFDGRRLLTVSLHPFRPR
jgi:hypothetical protein